MNCINCGHEIPEGYKFCPNCGAQVVKQETTEIQTIDRWQKHLPLIGAGVGIVSGLISLAGWFSPWTSLKFGNGPQLIALPFGLNAGVTLLNRYPELNQVISGVDQITGWFLLGSIVLAIISIVLVAMCAMIIWKGIKCLEYRSDTKMLGTVKTQINKMGNYAVTGIVLSAIVMIMLSIFQVGQSAIGGGLVAMVFGFIVCFVLVIYLKPHLQPFRNS